MKDAFQDQAAGWDDNPVRTAMAAAFTRELRRLVAIRNDWAALEFGCGTGLAGLRVAQLTGSLTMADASEAMLGVLRRKIAAGGHNNISVTHVGNGHLPFPDASFNLVFTLMTLHHVEDVEGALREFLRVLKPGGHAVACDLVAEDGGFHAPETAPHNGFDLGELQALVSRLGFASSETRLHHAIKKPTPAGDFKRYPQFILSARKE